jgi:ABC-type uncharacterized transport system fused permease/ATPase subunit
MMTRNQREFWSLWRRVVGVAVVVTIHRNLYRFTESRLAVVWRKKLTDVVHKEYFNDMGWVTSSPQIQSARNMLSSFEHETTCLRRSSA